MSQSRLRDGHPHAGKTKKDLRIAGTFPHLWMMMDDVPFTSILYRNPHSQCIPQLCLEFREVNKPLLTAPFFFSLAAEVCSCQRLST